MRSYVRAIVAVALPLALVTGAGSAMPTSTAAIVSLVRHTAR
ncbi:MAG TPA: hypothetical protein VIJ12_09235 [Candidatus Baltobacteraceae bacterium]